MEALLTEADPAPNRLGLDEIKREVASFALNFEERFEKAPIEEKKELVQRCISKIVVDREKMVARFYVARIPAGSRQLESLFKVNSDGSVMSTCSARNRRFNSVTMERHSASEMRSGSGA